MSELCCKFQMPASHTVGGVSEIRTVLQRVTDRRMEVQTDKSKTICPSSLPDGGIIINNILKIPFNFLTSLSLDTYSYFHLINFVSFDNVN